MRARFHKTLNFIWCLFFSTNHKDIGSLYLLFGGLSGVIGAVLSIVLRMELAWPESQVLHDNFQLYNILIAVHIFVMTFCMLNLIRVVSIFLTIVKKNILFYLLIFFQFTVTPSFKTGNLSTAPETKKKNVSTSADVVTILLLFLPGSCVFWNWDQFKLESKIPVIQFLDSYLFLIIPTIAAFLLLTSSSQVAKFIIGVLGISQLSLVRIFPAWFRKQDKLMETPFFVLNKVFTTEEKIQFLKTTDRKAFDQIALERVQAIAEHSNSLSDFNTIISQEVLAIEIASKQALQRSIEQAAAASEGSNWLSECTTFFIKNLLPSIAANLAVTAITVGFGYIFKRWWDGSPTRGVQDDVTEIKNLLLSQGKEVKETRDSVVLHGEHLKEVKDRVLVQGNQITGIQNTLSAQKLDTISPIVDQRLRAVETAQQVMITEVKRSQEWIVDIKKGQFNIYETLRDSARPIVRQVFETAGIEINTVPFTSSMQQQQSVVSTSTNSIPSVHEPISMESQLAFQAWADEGSRCSTPEIPPTVQQPAASTSSGSELLPKKI